MKYPKKPLAWVALLILTTVGCGHRGPDNVLLIVVDTLRADHLSLYGYERPTSPELERWAVRGLVFEQALATSPWTLPTFGSVLTGLWPAQHAAGGRLEDSEKWRRAPLSSSVTTLPEVLQRNGLTTAAIVNNAFLWERFGVARGFEFYDYDKGRRAASVVDLAQSWLSEHGQEPFFLMIHMIDPHLPYVPPAEFLGKFGELSEEAIEPRRRGKIVDRLPELSPLDRASLVARYDEEISFVDQQLGRLFGFLEAQGLWEQTLVVLTSDHGEELFDHGGFEHGHSMFQELLRVPLVFWGPGVPAGRSEAPVSLVDLAPTIYEAIGIASEGELSGVSLWGSPRRDQLQQRREILAQNTLRGREYRALVAWPYKLILDTRSGGRRLYHLEDDPAETRDLAPDKAELAQELERRLVERLAEIEVKPTEPEVVLTDEVEAELHALGYLD